MGIASLCPYLHACLQETKASDDNVDMSERQPLFLKDKGDAMHRSGNYRAAINAYTKALELDASLTMCYANRAASYLKAQDYRQAALSECIEIPVAGRHHGIL